MINHRKFKLSASAVSVIGAIAIAYFGNLCFVNAASQNRARDRLAGITFTSTFTDTDTRYLQTSLDWLREYLPDWYTYIATAQPILFVYDESIQTRGIISHAKCCDSDSAGAITFGAHLGQWQVADAARVEGMQSQQIQFLSVLIHEVAHIRDARAGRIAPATDARTCIAAEQSANDQELAFARALATAQIRGDATASANYRISVDKHLQITENNANGIVWKIFCDLSFMRDTDRP